LANSAVTDAKIAAVAGSKVSGNITGNAANVTGTVAVANGGTGATTLTANNVLLGNGTSALQAVAPGTSGNVLTSNGTTWTSAAASGGGGLPTTGNTAGDMLYWNGTEWVKVASGTNGQTLTFINNVPTWFGYNQTVVSPTGKIWMDRNLGASQVATSSTDHLSYGSLYQWGRNSDGHQLINWTSSVAGAPANASLSTSVSSSDTPGSLYISVNTSNNSTLDWRSPKNDLLWQGVNGINNPCPTGFRLPTETEWNNERLSWTSNSSAGSFASPLKLPMAGARFNTNSHVTTFGGTGGMNYYWSSTITGNNAKILDVSPSSAQVSHFQRYFALSVRCIKN
jgi:uncharacterized protein (TIGR02145 family)